MCGADGVCIYARDPAYKIRIPGWTPASCIDNALDADADLYWQLKIDDQVVAQSDWVQGGCPGSWPAETKCIPAGTLYGAWYLGAYDEDGPDDELRDSLWWDFNGDGVPNPIAPKHLHAGIYSGATGSGGALMIDFVPVASCR